MMRWELTWTKCLSQYDADLTFSSVQHQLIAQTRWENGWMKFFTWCGLGAGDNSNGHQDLRTSQPHNFSSGLIWSQSTINELQENTLATVTDVTPQNIDYRFHGNPPTFRLFWETWEFTSRSVIMSIQLQGCW